MAESAFQSSCVAPPQFSPYLAGIQVAIIHLKVGQQAVKKVLDEGFSMIWQGFKDIHDRLVD